MSMHRLTARLALAATLALPLLAAHAPATAGGIDPNTFRPGHPASPRWVVPHANGEHPAVLQARHAAQAATIDANTFIVQPPASTRWTAASAPALPAPTLLAKAR